MIPTSAEYEKLLKKVEELERELKGCQQAEQILWQLPDQLFSVLNCIDAVVYVADMETYELLFVNKQARKVFGDIVGEKCWQALQSGQSGPCSFCTNDRLLDTNGRSAGVVEWEFHNTADDKWYNIKDKAITWVDGRTVRLEIATDITSQKEYETRPALSEERFRTFADYTYNWEYWIAPDQRLLYVSPSCKRITGYEAEDFLSDQKLLFSIVHPEDRQQFIDHIRYELSEETVAEIEFRIVAATGEIRWISHNCQPVYDREGNHLGRHASNRDITARMEIEEALKESEKLFRLALDATSDGLWDRNLVTGQVHYGRNWAEILGYTPEEIKRKGLTWEALLHPDDRPYALAAVEDHLKGRTPRYVAEFRMRNRTGQYQWILARGKVVERDEEGRPLRFVGTHSDISQRKKAEREMIRGNQKIKEFAYSIIHDLKNPSIVTYGLADKLLQKYHHALDDKGKTFCEHIKRSAEQIANLVEKINTFIATQENPLELENLSIEECVRITREEFLNRFKSRNIVFLYPEELPAILADRISILRALQNLVDNALKYGGEKLTTIEIGHTETATHHVISVHDDGVGLKHTETKGIFRKFMRKKTALGIEGTGIGLAVVREIARQHKGELWLDHPRKGITFSFSIAKSI